MYKCVNRIKNEQGVIINYILQDEKGVCVSWFSQKLKKAIKDKQICVQNLTLTKNNQLRLISNNSQQSKEEERIKKLVANYRLMGKALQLTTCEDDQYCYLVSLSNIEHILYIPDDTIQLDIKVFQNNIKHLKGEIHFVGGRGLVTLAYVFSDCKFCNLDFSLFHTDSVETMSHAFYRCETPNLDLRSFTTKNVTNMYKMFYDCTTGILTLPSFDINKIHDMSDLFEDLNVKKVIITRENTPFNKAVILDIPPHKLERN